MADAPFRFTQSVPRSFPRKWKRSGAFLLLLAGLGVGAVFLGEKSRDWYYSSRLTGGRWIGEEEEPGGLWTREVEYRFAPDGQLDSIQRFLRQGETRPETSHLSLRWEFRHSFLIISSPDLGPMPARVLRLNRNEMVFGEQARIKIFRKWPD